MRVAFMGLGIMGRPMAANLVEGGSRSFGLESLRGQGSRRRKDRYLSRRRGAQDAEVVWMCVSDTNAVESVLFGPKASRNRSAEA